MTPRRMTPIGLAAALAAVAVALAEPARAEEPALPTLQPLVTRNESLEAQLVSAVNALRTSRGLRALRVAPGLRTAAAAHSTNMARLGFFDHTSATGVPYWRRIRTYYGSRGYRRWGVGENLVYASPAITAGEAMHEWLTSAPHRANLFTRAWRDVGVGAVQAVPAPGVFGNLPTTVVTLDFGYRTR